MVVESKTRQALHALNALLVGARSMAREKASHDDIEYVLDCAEYLPMLILEGADRTDDFRGALVGIASRFPDFGVAVERFDATGNVPL